MGSFLLTAGTKGKRYALPNARIMVHQPSGGAQGQATDIEIQAREILNTRARLNAIYVKHTGQSLAAIEAAVERDRFMSPEEAKTFPSPDAGRAGQEQGLSGRSTVVSGSMRLGSCMKCGKRAVVSGVVPRRRRPVTC